MTLLSLVLPVAIDALSVLSYVGLSLLILSLTLVLWGEAKEQRIWVAIFKPIASLGFLIFAYAAIQNINHTYVLAILIALILSALGDILLIKQDDRSLLFGLIAFLLAHVAYSVACISYAGYSLTLLMFLSLAIIGGVVAYRYFKTHMPLELQTASMAYIAVIALMVASTLHQAYLYQSSTLALAGIAFWFSDISVARARFMRVGFLNRLWGLPLYYWAQILFACTLYDTTLYVSQ